MKLDGIGLSTLDVPERAEVHALRDRGGGERFSVEGISGPDGAGDNPRPNAVDRPGGRRRGPVRMSRRTDGTHAAKDQHAEETRVTERGDFHLDLDPVDPDGAQGGEEESGAEERAAAADFEALTAHLLRLGGPIREVTLYLPFLGQVSARMEAGAISILVSVPRRLVGAVRRGEGELRAQMARLGLRVSEIQIREREEPREERRAQAAPRYWPARGLVDVMA